MSHFAPAGMHYVVFEIWPDGSEHFIMECKDLRVAQIAMHEAWQRLIPLDSKARIGLRCVDE